MSGVVEDEQREEEEKKCVVPEGWNGQGSKGETKFSLHLVHCKYNNTD